MTRSRTLRTLVLLLSGFASTNLLQGCVMVGYSSRGGFFVWPGGIGLLLLLLVLWLLLRPR